MKILVIVPAYNSEQFIGETLENLLNQTLKDIEVIVVNDGSTDGTQNIIDEYCKKSDIFKSYIKENGHLIKQGYFTRVDYLEIIDNYYLKNYLAAVSNSQFQSILRKVSGVLAEEIYITKEGKKILEQYEIMENPEYC